MNEIAKFSILDEKTKFTILDEIWTKNGQLIAEPNAIRDRDTGTTMSIKSGAWLCGTFNMLVAEYKISADVKSALTFQGCISLYGLGNQYIFVHLQIKYFSIAQLHLDEN